MVEFDKNKKLILSKSLKKAVISRQTAPKVCELNASIYVWKRDALKNFKN